MTGLNGETVKPFKQFLYCRNCQLHSQIYYLMRWSILSLKLGDKISQSIRPTRFTILSVDWPDSSRQNVQLTGNPWVSVCSTQSHVWPVNCPLTFLTSDVQFTDRYRRIEASETVGGDVKAICVVERWTFFFGLRFPWTQYALICRVESGVLSSQKCDASTSSHRSLEELLQSSITRQGQGCCSQLQRRWRRQTEIAGGHRLFRVGRAQTRTCRSPTSRLSTGMILSIWKHPYHSCWMQRKHVSHGAAKIVLRMSVTQNCL